jgi:hypothetical protein
MALINFKIFKPIGCFLFLSISFISLYSFKNSKKRKIFLPFDMLSSMDLALVTDKTFFYLKIIREYNILT